MSDIRDDLVHWIDEMDRSASEALTAARKALFEINRLRAAEAERDEFESESEEVVQAFERWKPLTDSLGVAAHKLVGELHKAFADRDRAEAERDEALAKHKRDAADWHPLALEQQLREQGKIIESLRAERDEARAELSAARASKSIAEARTDATKAGKQDSGYMLAELHRERQRIIDELGLGESDAGYLDGFGWNLVDHLRRRLAAGDAARAEVARLRDLLESAEHWLSTGGPVTNSDRFCVNELVKDIRAAFAAQPEPGAEQDEQ